MSSLLWCTQAEELKLKNSQIRALTNKVRHTCALVLLACIGSEFRCGHTR